ncbi:MAG: type I-E CRISPR-associated protein Cas7/Cse4/CasC [Clostridiales bacterium]|nr:type I-E CRISPR-associated protein Cas7/Cse4/CasC [Candidatus Cacconaster stercorequi]
MKNSLYIDLHAIQTVPPSCVNRDDTGSPKTAIYGGVKRARVSSQAWKRAIREYFKTIFDVEALGSRTKQLPKLIADEIMAIDETIAPEKAMKSALKALKNVGIKLDEKKNENAALFFVSKSQIRALAALAAAEEKDKAVYKQAMKDHPTLDIALFGRMVAGDPSLNYDATAQVAHAISTHGVQIEYDYFAAVDDEKADDESGAGFLDTAEFNSATLYRYATVNVTELATHLGADTPQVVRGFVEAFACSMPTGKQNTFANRTLPDLLYVTIRRDQPVNLSGAFENPIKNQKNGYVGQSCQSLLAYADKLCSSFAEQPELALGCGDEAVLSGHAEVLSLKALLARLEEYTGEKTV